jgi:hypothetical protein
VGATLQVSTKNSITSRNEYDLGIKGGFDTTRGEPRLILYVSIQIPGEARRKSIPITLCRTTWARRRDINAVQARDELHAAATNLNSEAVRVLIDVAERKIPARLQTFENSRELDQTEINVDALEFINEDVAQILSLTAARVE